MVYCNCEIYSLFRNIYLPQIFYINVVSILISVNACHVGISTSTKHIPVMHLATISYHPGQFNWLYVQIVQKDQTSKMRIEPRIQMKDTLKLGIQTNNQNQGCSSWESQIIGLSIHNIHGLIRLPEVHGARGGALGAVQKEGGCVLLWHCTVSCDVLNHAG